MSGRVDPIVLELIQTRLTSVVREMRNIMIRTARSPMIHEGHDFSCAVLSPAGAVIATRDAWFDEARASVAVYELAHLPVDAPFEGPAIVEEDGATTVITPGWAARKDRSGNLRLSYASRN